MDRRPQNVLLNNLPVSVATFLLASWQSWPLRKAQFGPIDDHRFATLRGNRIESLWDGLRNASRIVLDIGRTPFFRPLIPIEDGLASVVFGPTPSGFFLYGFLKYFVILILLGALVRQLVTVLAGSSELQVWLREAIVFSTVVASASINAWHGIVPRTGPSESLLAIGFLLSASFSMRVCISETPRIINAFWLFFGVIVCAGAKESGIASVVFLLLAARPLVAVSAKSRLLRGGVITGTLICALFPIHALLFIFLGQSDVYGTERNKAVVVQSLGERLLSPMQLVLILAALVIHSSVPRASEHRRLALAFVGVLILLWTMDGAVYELDSPNLRYRMIYQIIEVLVIGSALMAGLMANVRSLRQSVCVTVAYCFSLNVVAVPIGGYQTLRQVSQATADVTTSYWSSVENLAREAKKQQRPVVLFSFDAAASYEPIVAMITYLRYLKVDVPISVFNAEPPDEVWNSSEWLAVQSMQTAGTQGTSSPLNTISSQKWTCVGFSVSLDNPSQPLYNLVQEKCAAIERI